MSTDYEAIREENRGRYGWDRGFWKELLAGIYSHRTHFIFELLQNAEDARHTSGGGARRISFELERDGLTVRHDGRPFSAEDVNGICRVGRGTKRDDPESIGKFGIGFKSVYAYTRTPRIDCPPEHFEITDYVDPKAIEPSIPGTGWTTRFTFPFDNPEVSPHLAYKQIRDSLASLSHRTLLFVHHLSFIQWKDNAGNSGTMNRRPLEGLPGMAFTIEKVGGESESWIRLSRAVRIDGRAMPVELAFKIERDQEGRLGVVRADDATLATYFPTRRETQCGFIVQAPFDVTPTRESLHEDQEVNRQLIQTAADFLPDALETLRDAGLLREESLEILPLFPPNFAKDPFLAPLLISARRALKSRQLVPVGESDWGTAAQVRAPQSQELRELLDEASLSALFGSSQPVRWVSPNVTRRRTPELFRCLAGHTPAYPTAHNPRVKPLEANFEVSLERFLDSLTPSFLSGQSDSWMLRLYEYLATQPKYHDKCRTLPIVRLTDGAHRTPFDTDGKQQVWLPPKEGTRFPAVRSFLVGTKAAREFLRALGLSEPGIADNLIHSVLPQYPAPWSPESEGPTREVHEQNLAAVCEALRQCPPAKRDELLSALRRVAFVRASHGEAPGLMWARPDRLLWARSEGARAYGIAAGFRMLGESDAHAELWSALDLPSEVPVTIRNRGTDGHIVLRKDHGDHARGRHGFDPDFRMRGLETALAQPNLELARYLWQIALQYVAQLRGEVERATRQDYSNATRETVLSQAGRVFTEHAWVPNREGVFCKPSSISLAELDESLDPDERLATALGMPASADHDMVARALGLAPEDMIALRALLDDGTFTEWKEKRAKADAANDARAIIRASGDTPSLPFAIAANQNDANEDDIAHTTLPQVGPRTASSVKEALTMSLKHDAPVREEVRVGTGVQLSEQQALTLEEARNRVAADYGGRCQICQRTFLQRKGAAHDRMIYQWQSITRDQGLAFDGNLLSLCAWHHALMSRGRFTLLTSEGATGDAIAHFVCTAEPSETGAGDPCYSLPIWFHNIAQPDTDTTESEETRITFSGPHWLALKELLGEFSDESRNESRAQSQAG